MGGSFGVGTGVREGSVVGKLLVGGEVGVLVGSGVGLGVADGIKVAVGVAVSGIIKITVGGVGVAVNSVEIAAGGAEK